MNESSFMAWRLRSFWVENQRVWPDVWKQISKFLSQSKVWPFWIQCHHVEVMDVILMSFSKASLTFFLVYQITNILIHKLALQANIWKWLTFEFFFFYVLTNKWRFQISVFLDWIISSLNLITMSRLCQYNQQLCQYNKKIQVKLLILLIVFQVLIIKLFNNHKWRKLSSTPRNQFPYRKISEYLFYISSGLQTPPTTFSLVRLLWWIQAFCKELVLAVFACRTKCWMTLVHHHGVETFRVSSTRVLLVRLTFTLWQLREICFLDYYTT